MDITHEFMRGVPRFEQFPRLQIHAMDGDEEIGCYDLYVNSIEDRLPIVIGTVFSERSGCGVPGRLIAEAQEGLAATCRTHNLKFKHEASFSKPLPGELGSAVKLAKYFFTLCYRSVHIPEMDWNTELQLEKMFRP